MLRRSSLPFLCLALAASSAAAQGKLKTLLPSDEAVSRHGLVRRWYSFAPVDGVQERVERVMVVGDQIHMQTNASRIHVLDGETGKLLWTAQMGKAIPGQFGSAINSHSVFVINGTSLYRLSREDGARLWSLRLPQAPNAAPAADESRVLVSTADGRIYVYNINTKEMIWFYQTNAAVSMPALLLDEKIAVASQDGMMYVFQASSRNPTVRYKTDKAVSAPMAAWGRAVLLPSRDYNVYAVDVRSGETLWWYPSGAEIRRPVTVIENDVFVTPEESGIHMLDAADGTLKWLYPRADEFVASSKNRVYATDKFGQLLILDRSNGRLMGMWETHQYDFHVRNDSNDRLYMATKTGFVVCLHEKENKEPVAHLKVEPPPSAGMEFKKKPTAGAEK